MPVVQKFSIVGPDGSGKSYAVSLLLDKNAPRFRLIAAVGRPTFIQGRDFKRRFLFLPQLRRLDLLHAKADSIHSKPLIVAISLMDAALRQKICAEVEQKYAPDITISVRNHLLDKAAYIPFYLPVAARTSIERRFKIIGHIPGCTSPDAVVYLSIDPQVAFQRIDKRVVHEPPEKGSRVRFVHMHENPTAIALFIRELEAGLSYLAKQGTRILQIDTVKNGPEEVVAQITREFLS